MKKLICLFLAFTMILFSASALAEAAEAPAENLFTPGTYTAEEQGIFAPVKVQITVSENLITGVKIDATGETPELGGLAAGKLAASIMKAQTPNVDALSGATVTSNAIIKAATAALEEAGADISVLDANRRDGGDSGPKEEKTVDTEIVVIGAGGAGMTAAIMLHQAGRSFVLLEKMPYAGGNTTKATGGMNAAETHYQKEQGIEDSTALFAADTMKGGHALNDPSLVAMMANKSAEAIDWLDTIGASLPKISYSGGASVNRIHAPEDGSGVGGFLVDRFSAKLEELGVEILYNTSATELLTDGEGKICGVKADGEDCSYTFNCKAVILATGGFGANEEMYTQYRPDLKGTVTTNAPGATGDGILMAQALGADLVDIEQIQLHPTVEQTTSILITESVRGDGAILVNSQGVRFTNELLTRDAVSAAELAQEGQFAWIIFDQNLRDHLKATEKYVKSGITVQADTIEGLAELLEIDPATLAKTLEDWNGYVKNQRDPDFGRTTGMDADLTTPPYYAIKIAPGIHHTMGGVKINTAAQVINTEGQPIPGLFAAGEVTGGVHGGNRLGGNAVADIVIFGRIAAESALDYIK
jgi:fumarate reductase flavoprotein subunit